MGFNMNIIKKELKLNKKVFLFWCLGLFFLIYAGMTKYLGFETQEGAKGIEEIFDKFPRIILAMFGMLDVDIKTANGYYVVLSFYTIICICIYSISLGTNVVSRENIDKTSEFIYTKPRKKTYILNMKILAGFFYIVIFSLINLVFSILSLELLKIEDYAGKVVFDSSIVIFLLGVLFYSLSIFITVLIKKEEKANTLINLAFLTFFIIGIIHDLIKSNFILRIFTPLRYFKSADILEGNLNIGFIFASIILSVTMIYISNKIFEKKDIYC